MSAGIAGDTRKIVKYAMLTASTTNGHVIRENLQTIEANLASGWQPFGSVIVTPMPDGSLQFTHQLVMYE